MADRDKSGRFLPGVVTNVKGRPKQSIELEVMKELSRDFVEIKIIEFLRKSFFELTEILQDYEKESIDHMLAAIILAGIRHGSYAHLNFLFDRVIGQVQKKVEPKVPKPFIIEGLNGERIELGMKEGD